jgi:hypothetical protein
VVRWTVGAVSDEGFDALGWSIAGAWQLFGPSAQLVVCVNSIPVEAARRRAGPVRAPVVWLPCTARQIPAFLRRRLDDAFAEGAGWKFAPVRVSDGRELSLDNDCILWDRPAALDAWLHQDDRDLRCLVAEDVQPCFGQFAPLCGSAPRNGGMRGLPPGPAYVRALRDVLAEHPVTLSSELDEQGLQVSAAMRCGAPHVVTTAEVTICSPFHPHQAYAGSCGAHFVGLNAHALPWSCNGRRATEMTRDHWRRLRDEVAARIAR